MAILKRVQVMCHACFDGQNNTELFVTSIPEVEGAVSSKAGKKPSTSFEFDRVFGASSTQAEVFEEVCALAVHGIYSQSSSCCMVWCQIQPMVVSALDGFHACIFAYGQTGAGKSYTMTGPVTDRGVNFRTLSALFAAASERKSSFEYSFKVWILQQQLVKHPLAWCSDMCCGGMLHLRR